MPSTEETLILLKYYLNMELPQISELKKGKVSYRFCENRKKLFVKPVLQLQLSKLFKSSELNFIDGQ